MYTTKQIEALNARITKLNKESVQARARMELLTANLGKDVNAYAGLYGVNLKGATLKETLSKIQAEKNAVESQLEAELNLHLKVVEAIESGNIEEANRLLGVVPAETAEPEEVEEPEEVKEPEETGSEGDSEDFDGFFSLGDEEPEPESKPEPKPQPTVMATDDGVDYDALFATLNEDSDSPATGFVTPVSKAKAPAQKPVVQAKPTVQAKAPAQKPTTQAKAPAQKPATQAKAPVESSGPYGDFGITEEDLKDFGFGDMLQGSPFSAD